MFKAYNEMIAYMDGLYNAESADGYEPLTDEEMAALSISNNIMSYVSASDVLVQIYSFIASILLNPNA